MKGDGLFFYCRDHSLCDPESYAESFIIKVIKDCKNGCAWVESLTKETFDHGGLFLLNIARLGSCLSQREIGFYSKKSESARRFFSSPESTAPYRE